MLDTLNNLKPGTQRKSSVLGAGTLPPTIVSNIIGSRHSAGSFLFGASVPKMIWANVIMSKLHNIGNLVKDKIKIINPRQRKATYSSFPS